MLTIAPWDCARWGTADFAQRKVPARLVEVLEVVEMDHSGVVHEHIELAEGVHGRGDGSFDLVRSRHVAADGQRADALRLHLLGRRLELGLARELVGQLRLALTREIGESHVRARLAEGERDAASDAARGTGDQGDLAVEGGGHGGAPCPGWVSENSPRC